MGGHDYQRQMSTLDDIAPESHWSSASSSSPMIPQPYGNQARHNEPHGATGVPPALAPSEPEIDLSFWCHDEAPPEDMVRSPNELPPCTTGGPRSPPHRPNAPVGEAFGRLSEGLWPAANAVESG